MQILVLEYLTRQTEKNRISKANVKKIYREYAELIKQRNIGDAFLRAYLNNRNGKKLKGSETGKIFKYQLTDGDRIAYMWGEDLPFLRPEEKDSLILIGYSKHDDQDDFAVIPKKQRYKNVEDILEISEIIFETDMQSIEGEDFDTIISLIVDSYNDSRTMYLIDPENISDEDENDEIWALRLSDEQNSIIEKIKNNVKPTLIMGGAGTGKTVLAVHLLNVFTQKEESNCVYFTQSRELLNKVIQQYQILTGKFENDNAGFKDINEFCIEFINTKNLNLSRKNLVMTSEFCQFIDGMNGAGGEIKQLGLSSLDLWTEIRGVIKGSLNSKWLRNAPISMYDKSFISNSDDIEALKELEEKNLVERYGNDNKEIVLGNNPDGVQMSANASKVMNKLLDYFNVIDWSLEEISLEDYLNLSDERTIIESEEKRRKVYSFYLQYKNWLHNNGYYDENDLVRLVMNYKEDLKQYDFIIVDEVQDYTEFQIRLIYELSKNKQGLIYAGDSNQIINPTVFNERRLKALHNRNIEYEQLRVNFRCQKEIVRLSNSLAKIRRECVATGSENRELPEEALRNGKAVIQLEATDENLNKLIKELIKYPNVAVLVADEITKQKLINRIGADEYAKAKNHLIYSISEIKGMEYKYVFCYDIISCFNEVWERILQQNKIKLSRYRYYFNLFYVAITRAEKYLCLMENNDNKLLTRLENTASDKFNFKYIHDFDLDNLYIDKLSNRSTDWITFADEYFSNGNYTEAKQNYINGGAPQIKIDQCDAEIAVNNKDFRTAIKLFIKLDNIRRVRQYIEEIDKNDELFLLANIMIDPQFIASIDGLDGKSLTRIINHVFEKEESYQIYERLILQFDDAISEKMNGRMVYNGN